jgi:hypothetical protein
MVLPIRSCVVKTHTDVIFFGLEECSVIQENHSTSERSHAKTQARQNTRPSLYGGGIVSENDTTYG